MGFITLERKPCRNIVFLIFYSLKKFKEIFPPFVCVIRINRKPVFSSKFYVDYLSDTPSRERGFE